VLSPRKRDGSHRYISFDSVFVVGITVLMEDFLKAAIPKIPTLAGLKFTSIDLFDLGRCLVLGEEKIQILFGGDEVSR